MPPICGFQGLGVGYVGYLMQQYYRRFKEVSVELGIEGVEVDEAYSSKTCTLCGEAHENGVFIVASTSAPHE